MSLVDTKTNFLIEKFPKISIITPSYNQGHFLEDTITSVIGQCYPNLEFIIIDGGSSDNSKDIIQKYEDFITYWVSEKDNGQAHAINKGFSLASGEIIAWLNSDDMFLPGTLKYLSTIFNIHNELPLIVFGNCFHLNEKKKTVIGSDVTFKHQTMDIELADYIIQPSCFWKKSVLDLVGPLNEKLHFCFDWEWFIRAKRKDVIFHAVDRYLAIYRIHDEHKSGTGGENRINELAEIYKNFHSQQLSEDFLYYKQSISIRRAKKLFKKLPVNWARWLHFLYFRNRVSLIKFYNFSRM